MTVAMKQLGKYVSEVNNKLINNKLIIINFIIIIIIAPFMARDAMHSAGHSTSTTVRYVP